MAKPVNKRLLDRKVRADRKKASDEPANLTPAQAREAGKTTRREMKEGDARRAN